MCVLWDLFCVCNCVVSAEVNLACSLPPVLRLTLSCAPSRTLQWDTDPSVLQLQADSELGQQTHRMGPSKITQVNFLPRELVSYSKATQTPLAALQSEDDRQPINNHSCSVTCREVQ
ncbi:cytoplasmic dynein 1 intermediate chain 1-like [Xyrauchen texanus]|uniref:cytoplasmic dynein 1 intermediate chain 1-like n=1 Tax=Xyrauchen texanus TaxID=154827 RepID=UPI002241F49D|nr:cytoplasmic dynein 1 intermediate chain 1-like [Xyrauchen texanus]